MNVTVPACGVQMPHGAHVFHVVNGEAPTLVITVVCPGRKT